MSLVRQEYELVQASTLVLDPDNPHESDEAGIADSIEANGFYGAVLAQRSSRRVIAGHGRVRAALAEGLEDVPVIWLEVDDERAQRILLADNRLPELGGFDQEKLLAALGALPDLAGTGYAVTDLDALGLELEQMISGERPGSAESAAQPAREPIVAVLIAVPDVATVEQALAATGEPSRAAALLALARAYLDGA